MTRAGTSPEKVRIAVDCMGGDHGPSVTLPFLLAGFDRFPVFDEITYLCIQIDGQIVEFTVQRSENDR